MGLAVGRLGMSPGDLMRLTLPEFEAIVDESRRARESDHRDRWECMRMLATISIQPHTKKQLSPRELLPFPWERSASSQIEAQETPVQVDKETRYRRVAYLMQMVKNS